MITNADVDLIQQLTKAARRTHHYGLTVAYGGNLSAKDSQQNLIYIKQSGTSFGDAGESDFSTVDWDGKLLAGGKPSKELWFHLGIYHARPEVSAVLHCHSPYTVVAANIYQELPLLTVTGAKTFGRVTVLPKADPGSEILAKWVIDAYQEQSTKAVILQNHGQVVVGKTPMECFHLAQLLEDSAKVAYLSYLANK